MIPARREAGDQFLNEVQLVHDLGEVVAGLGGLARVKGSGSRSVMSLASRVSLSGMDVMRKLAVAFDLSDRSEWVGPGQLVKATRPSEEIAKQGRSFREKRLARRQANTALARRRQSILKGLARREGFAPR